nr:MULTISPECIES: NAD(P)H-binding protein [unclassified Arthrobacter]
MQAALSNAPVVIHLAGGAKGDDLAAGHLVSAALTTDVRHLILISVIGADIMPINYFRAKLAAEEAVKTSGVPYTIIRVAQVQRARALNTWTVPVRLPGAAGRAYRRGDNLAGQPVQRRGETWKEYLESVFPQDVND